MARPTVALVDSGGTNIASVSYALERIGADARLTNNPADIRAADRVILPGVGAAGAGMARLREAGLVEVLHEVEQPLLGVCLGMQLLFAHSAEDGGTECLGLLPGRVVPIPPAPGLRVPHQGWNTLTNLHADPLTEGQRQSDHPRRPGSQCGAGSATGCRWIAPSISESGRPAPKQSRRPRTL